MVRDAVCNLAPRERELIELRYGMRTGREMTQKEVADLLGISQSYISRLEKKIIKRLKKEGRPIINTEWLGRVFGNDVFSLFPIFYLEKIGCYNWGFVAGKYQTYEPWEGTWKNYYEGVNTDIDFTKWFHDLYRPNHRPYDPRETDLIKEFCELADKDFEKSKK